jgi:hypothetical protein
MFSGGVSRSQSCAGFGSNPNIASSAGPVWKPLMIRDTCFSRPATRDGYRHGKDVPDRCPDLPAAEKRVGKAHPVSRGPQGPGGAGGA